jgi:hypothetical protein
MQEAAEFVVGAIQPEPDRGDVPRLRSLAQLLHQRGFAETRRRADQRQRSIARLDPLDQPRALDGRLGRPGRRKPARSLRRSRHGARHGLLVREDSQCCDGDRVVSTAQPSPS